MIELMPHQEEAILKLGNGKILHGGVGSGKSLTVLKYYMLNEAPKDIVVITTAKKRDSLDWIGEAAKFGIGTERGLTLAGTISVDSWNNIGTYTDAEDCFFVFDEQRLVGTGAWTKAFQKIAKRNRWVLLSATPGDTWIDYVPVFIANGLYKNATQFKLEHVVYAPFTKYPKIQRYTHVSTLESYRNMLLVEMPFEKHTKRHLKDVILNHDVDLFNKATVQRWHPYEERPIQDVGEMFRVMRKVVNSDRSRLQEIIWLLDRHPKMIIFYSFDYELEILRELADVPDLGVGEWNGHRKHPIPDTEKWVYLVQYVSGAEGWNCVETDTIVFYSLTYSYRNFEQAQGRIDRLDTPFTDLWYYVFMSNSVIDRAIRKSNVQKELFNERKWALKNLPTIEDLDIFR